MRITKEKLFSLYVTSGIAAMITTLIFMICELFIPLNDIFKSKYPIIILLIWILLFQYAIVKYQNAEEAST